MKSYCLKCRNDTENINPKVLNTSRLEKRHFTKYAICGCKKSRFIKKSRSKRTIMQFRC